jgi:Metal binding domain of Ada
VSEPTRDQACTYILAAPALAACEAVATKLGARASAASVRHHRRVLPACLTGETGARPHVEFFASAGAAEAAGYRPCVRCRPEMALFSPAWKGSRRTIERAPRLINQSALDEGGVEALAKHLGIGARHLSRLFQKHLALSYAGRKNRPCAESQAHDR